METDFSAMPGQRITELPTEAITDAPPTPSNAAETDQPAVPATNTDAQPESPVETVPSAEQPETPSSADADKTTDESGKPSNAENAKPDETAHPDDEKLPADVRGRLSKTAEYQREAKAFGEIKNRLVPLGGMPALDEALTIREAIENEDAPALFNTLKGISEGGFNEVVSEMVEAALQRDDWRDVAAELRFEKYGKSAAEIEAILDAHESVLAGQAGADADDASDYDADGNYIPPEVREERRQFEALKQENAGLRAAQEAAEQTKAQAAEAAQEAVRQSEFIASRDEFMQKTAQPIVDKFRDAGLYPEESDSPALKALKLEEIERSFNDLQRDFFEDKKTAAFAKRQQEYLARGERETAFKRLDAARALAEELATPYMQRTSDRISAQIALEAKQLTPTTTRTDHSAQAVARSGSPGNFAAASSLPDTPLALGQPLGVSEDRVRDALAAERRR